MAEAEAKLIPQNTHTRTEVYVRWFTPNNEVNHRSTHPRSEVLKVTEVDFPLPRCVLPQTYRP